jgi:hypothetical protein
LAGLALCKTFFTHLVPPQNYVATRMQSTFVAVDEGLTEENRLKCHQQTVGER